MSEYIDRFRPRGRVTRSIAVAAGVLIAPGLAGCGSEETTGEPNLYEQAAEDVAKGPVVMLGGAVVDEAKGKAAVRPLVYDEETGSFSCPVEDIGEVVSGWQNYLFVTFDHATETPDILPPSSTQIQISRLAKVVTANCVIFGSGDYLVGGIPTVGDFNGEDLRVATQLSPEAAEGNGLIRHTKQMLEPVG